MSDDDSLLDWYGLEGEPIGREEWLRLFHGTERLLRQTWKLGRDCRRYWISTVWIGIDHNFAAAALRSVGRNVSIEETFMGTDGTIVTVDTRPWIFETMAFEGVAVSNRVHAVTGEDVLQRRHASKEEALDYHDFLLLALEASGELPDRYEP